MSSTSTWPRAFQYHAMDFNSPIPLDFIRGKTILLTGGASGFGAAFFSRWAAEGATVIIGDINTVAGAELVARVREETQNPNLHFLPLDVTSWQSQVDFFREAVKLSPHGGIDTVVANAGINNAKESKYFEEPPRDYQNDPNPPAPRFSTIDVNLTGTLYTTHLALFYLPRNPGSMPCSPASSESSTQPPETRERDRHILLLGSVASILPLPSQTSYCVSKHGVMGLFRSLRATTPLRDGVRVNILCPYFTETPILGVSGKVILSGTALTDINHVCDAATRFVADPGCVGRSVVIAPKLRVRSPLSGPGPDGELEAGEERIPGMGGLKGIPDMQDVYDLATNPANSGLRAESKAGGDGREVRDIAIWEFYTHDLDDSELFTRRIIGIILITARVRGWLLFITDLWNGVTMVLKKALGGGEKGKKNV
ncbi:short chain alcohol dehydrogenase [Histoplasma capsulatum var. duboisii H88]|uniref:Short chain alcohol dehydrogenase n=1 Tax=Ajellomyces capsulatus (strain H88) TaxID=544711 RepID=A0A8A1LJK5_AJEC8|nr:short chain alcohol dehydrogenase [Histoplasma capsulatum var. duboisii H88]